MLLLGGVVLGILGNLFIETFMKLYDLMYPEVGFDILLISLLGIAFGICVEIFVIYKAIE